MSYNMRAEGGEKGMKRFFTWVKRGLLLVLRFAGRALLYCVLLLFLIPAALIFCLVRGIQWLFGKLTGKKKRTEREESEEEWRRFEEEQAALTGPDDCDRG